MDNCITITFGTPKYGWLPVTFCYKEFQIDFDASDALNNPIKELTFVTNQLQDNEIRQITWWLEPHAYFFNIEKRGNNFSLTVSETTDLHNENTETKVLLTIKGNEEEIIKPFRLALKHFYTLSYDKRHWHNDNE